MPSFLRPHGFLAALLLWAAATSLYAEGAGTSPTPAGAISLLRPLGLAYDAQGNLFIAEAGRHVISRLDLAGNLATVAGTGSQGFSGDGGPATLAQLDTPSGVALDSAGNLFIADTHNSRIRRVDAVTHIITTIAGSGAAGFFGDGTPATSAALASPLAVVFGPSGLLYIADSGNHRVRSVDLGSGVIASVIGTGRQGFSGDGDLATFAQLDTPSSLAFDAAGNLYLADTGNHRIRRVDAATHIISTVVGALTPSVLLRPLSLASTGTAILVADSSGQRVLSLDPSTGKLITFAGQGTQSFAGDAGPAVAASLDTPSALALSPSGGVAISDTGNQRIRQVGTDGAISTVAGLGTLVAGSLSLSGATTQSYGDTTLVAALSSGAASTGTVSLLDTTTGQTTLLGQSNLSVGSARFNLATLPAGPHLLQATFAGDLTHRPAQSQTIALTVVPRTISATISGIVSTTFGQPIPPLTATLSGVLPADATRVTPVAAIAALAGAAPGVYPVTVTLAGAASPNYTLAPIAGSFTIAKAPASTTLTQVGSTLAVQVPGISSHNPTGTVTLLTSAGTRLTTVLLDATGKAELSTATLADGVYTLTAIYSGDADYLSAQSAALTLTVGPPATPSDFSFSMASNTAQTVDAGGTAQFAVALKISGTAGLSGPIVLSASPLPAGFAVTFDPPVIPPGGAVNIFTVSIVTPRTLAAASLQRVRHRWIVSACVLPLAVLLVPRGRRRLLIGTFVALALCGCGARINSGGSVQASSSTYPLTLTGTSTNLDGSVLQHTVSVTLTVQ